MAGEGPQYRCPSSPDPHTCNIQCIAGRPVTQAADNSGRDNCKACRKGGSTSNEFPPGKAVFIHFIRSIFYYLQVIIYSIKLTGRFLLKPPLCPPPVFFFG